MRERRETQNCEFINIFTFNRQNLSDIYVVSHMPGDMNVKALTPYPFHFFFNFFIMTLLFFLFCFFFPHISPFSFRCSWRYHLFLWSQPSQFPHHTIVIVIVIVNHITKATLFLAFQPINLCITPFPYTLILRILIYN